MDQNSFAVVWYPFSFFLTPILIGSLCGFREVYLGWLLWAFFSLNELLRLPFTPRSKRPARAKKWLESEALPNLQQMPFLFGGFLVFVIFTFFTYQHGERRLLEDKTSMSASTKIAVFFANQCDFVIKIAPSELMSATGLLSEEQTRGHLTALEERAFVFSSTMVSVEGLGGWLHVLLVATIWIVILAALMFVGCRTLGHALFILSMGMITAYYKKNFGALHEFRELCGSSDEE